MLLYAAIGAFGLLFLLVMLFVGELFGGDHDVHVETDVGHGDADGGGPSIFSARVIASFLTAFGVGGVIARYYNLSHPLSSGIGFVAGIVLASIVYQFARLLYSQQASSEVRMSSLVGQTGRGDDRHSGGRRRTGHADRQRGALDAHRANGGRAARLPPGPAVAITALQRRFGPRGAQPDPKALGGSR